MTAVLVEQLATAVRDTGRLVAGIRDGRWELGTPCEDWTVRQLVDHLVNGNRLFAAALGGEAASSPVPEDGVPSGERVERAYQASCQALLDAVRQRDALDGLVHVPVGTVPAPVAVHLRIVEALVHGWDLAVATGQPPSCDEELAVQELAFTLDALRMVPPERTPFGPAQPVSDSAPAIDRLAARLGRRPRR